MSSYWESHYQGSRKRHQAPQRNTSSIPDEVAKLENAMTQWFETPSPDNTVDCDAFLNTTKAFNTSHPPAERLHLLAIFVESQNADWPILEEIYTCAINQSQHRKDRLNVLTSFVTSAISYLDWDRENSDYIYRLAEGNLQELIALEPDEAQSYYLYGYLFYLSKAKTTADALKLFEKCLQLDPGHAWAKLYQAHCFHDLGDFPAAYQAYDEVNPANFSGSISWRYEILLEQRAFCAFQFDKNLGSELHLQLLERWEKDPNLLKHAWAKDFIKVAQTELRSLLYDRALNLFTEFNEISDSFCFDFAAELRSE